MDNYTIRFIEDMWAHYSNLLYSQKNAPIYKRNYWMERLQFYYRLHEKKVTLTELLTQSTQL